MPQSNHPRYERDAEQSVQSAIEYVPKPHIIPPHLPKLDHLIRNEPQRHDIQHPLHHIQIPPRINRINRRSIQHQIQQRKEDLHRVLV